MAHARTRSVGIVAYRGFTIVELLIVVVVIAILSTIVFVSYTGVVGSAYNVAAKSAAKEFAETLQLYHAKYHKYPLQDTVMTLKYPIICLGGVASYPDPDKGCIAPENSYDIPLPQTIDGDITRQFNNELLKVADSLPAFTSRCLEDVTYNGITACSRGVAFSYKGGYLLDGAARSYIQYYLEGDQVCDIGVGTLAKVILPSYPMTNMTSGHPEQNYTARFRRDGTAVATGASVTYCFYALDD